MEWARYVIEGFRRLQRPGYLINFNVQPRGERQRHERVNPRKAMTDASALNMGNALVSLTLPSRLIYEIGFTAR
jgi:hypothetical protein